MVVLGLLLIAFGVIAILAALFSTSGTASLLGAELAARTIFLLGVAAGVAVLWGFTISKLGARRSIRHRRESKRLQDRSARLDRVENTRTGDEVEREP
jgi:membrane protein implicated in regulation of membrane protease activity